MIIVEPSLKQETSSSPVSPSDIVPSSLILRLRRHHSAPSQSANKRLVGFQRARTSACVCPLRLQPHVLISRLLAYLAHCFSRLEAQERLISHRLSPGSDGGVLGIRRKERRGIGWRTSVGDQNPTLVEIRQN